MKWGIGIVVATIAVVAIAMKLSSPSYKFLHVWIPDPSVAVLRDMAADRVRLTSRDLTSNGAKLATRTFEGTNSVLCEALPGALICEIDHGDLRVLDARTLADTHDINALVKKALPAANLGADYANFLVHADGTFDVPIGDTTDARIDLARGTVTSIEVPDRAPLRGGSRRGCGSDYGGTKHAGLLWSIEGDRLIRKRPIVEAEPTAAEAEIAPVPAPIPGGSVLTCSGSDAVFAISHDDTASKLARLDDAGRALWTAELGAHPDDVFFLGDWILVTTGESARRLIAVDLATGAVRWAASAE